MPQRKSSGRIKAHIDQNVMHLNILGMPFGSPTRKDKHGEFFSKNTEIYAKVGDSRVAVYFHGIAKDMKRLEIIDYGQAVISEINNDGVWFKASIDLDIKHAKELQAAESVGKLFASTAPAGLIREVAPDGEILKWAVAELSLIDGLDGKESASNDAVASVDLDMKTVYAKAGIELPKVFATESARLKANAAKLKLKQKKFSKGRKMNLAELLKKAREAANGDKELETKLKAMLDLDQSVPKLEEALKTFIKENTEEDGGFTGLDDNFVKGIVAKITSNVYKELNAKAPAMMKLAKLGSGGSAEEGDVEAFNHYLKTGDHVPAKRSGLYVEPNLDPKTPENFKAIWTSGSGSGAVVTPDGVHDRIVSKLHEINILFQTNAEIIFDPVQSMPIPYEDTSMTKFVRTAEAGSYDDDEGAVAAQTLSKEKYTKKIGVYQEVLQFSAYNLENWFLRRAADAADETINDAIAVGTGTNEPLGVMALTPVKTFASATAITATEIVELLYELPQRYRDNAVFMSNGTTAGKLHGLTGDNFQLLQTPQGKEGEMIARRIFEQQDIADMALDAVTVAFANFEFYTMIMERIQVLFDPFTGSDTGLVNWLLHFYMDGGPTIVEAFAPGDQLHT